MKNPKYCPVCKKWVETKVVCEMETLPVKGKDVTFETDVLHCCECDTDIFDRDLNNATLKRAYEIGGLKNE